MTENYYLANLLSVVSKIFEKLVNNKLFDHLQKWDLFSDIHCGSRPFQHQIFQQLYLIKLLGPLVDLRLLDLWHLIYPKFLTKRCMLVFFKNSSLMEFQVRYLVLFFGLFSVIDSFEWFWMGSLCKSIQLKLGFKAPFLVLHFSYYTLMTFLMLLLAKFFSLLKMLNSTLNVVKHLICGNSESWLLKLNLTYKTLYPRAGSGLLISILEKLNLFRLTNLIYHKTFHGMLLSYLSRCF